MKKIITLVSLTAIVVMAYSCHKKAAAPGGTAYLDLPANPYSYTFTAEGNQKATLGRVLFYDTHLSVNNAISCGSCHKQALGFADDAAFSAGYEGRLTKRNSKGIVNLNDSATSKTGFHFASPAFFWDGRETSLRNLISRPITNHVEMGIDNVEVLPAKLAALPYYADLFTKAYGDNNVTVDRISECVTQFLSSINSDNSRFDEFAIRGNEAAFSALEKQGFLLFNNKYNCGSCHHLESGVYTVEDFKDIGLDENYADAGRGTISGNGAEKGKFKTPDLRNVALTAPYMHDGRYKTLEEVVEHYSKNIKNSPNLEWQLKDKDGAAKQMNIGDADKTALIAFLQTLTDYRMVSDPKFSNPFKIK